MFLIRRNFIVLALVIGALTGAAVPLSVASADDSTISMRKLMKRVFVLSANGRVVSTAFSPDQQLVAGGSDGKVLIWNTKGELVKTLKDVAIQPPTDAPAADDPLREAPVMTRWMKALTFSPDSKKIAAACGDTVKFWDIETGALQSWTDHTEDIESIAFFPDGTKLTSGGVDKLVKVWDVATGKATNVKGDHLYQIVSVAVTQDGKSIISLGTQRKGRESGEVKFWNAETGVLERAFNVDDCFPPSAMLSPGGRILACREDNTGAVKIWDVQTGKFVRSVAGGAGYWVTKLAFSSDLRYLASAQTWPLAGFSDVKTGLELDTLTGPNLGPRSELNAIALSGDGGALAIGTQDSVQVWGRIGG